MTELTGSNQKLVGLTLMNAVDDATTNRRKQVHDAGTGDCSRLRDFDRMLDYQEPRVSFGQDLPIFAECQIEGSEFRSD